MGKAIRRGGETELRLRRESLPCFVSPRKGCAVRAGEMDGLLGWTEWENTSSTALWIKLFAVWKYIKGRDAEKSVYGLVKTQNVLWFCFSKTESLSCVYNHIVSSLKRDRKYFLNCVPVREAMLWASINFKRKSRVLTDAKRHLAHHLNVLLEYKLFPTTLRRITSLICV